MVTLLFWEDTLASTVGTYLGKADGSSALCSAYTAWVER